MRSRYSAYVLSLESYLLHSWHPDTRPRQIEFDNVERLRAIDFCEVVWSPQQLEAALAQRLAQLSLAWNTSSS